MEQVDNITFSPNPESFQQMAPHHEASAEMKPNTDKSKVQLTKKDKQHSDPVKKEEMRALMGKAFNADFNEAESKPEPIQTDSTKEEQTGIGK